MAKANAKKTLTKEEIKLRQQRRANMARRQMLAERHGVAVSNMKERQARLYGSYDDDYVGDSRSSKRKNEVAPAADTVDREFIRDMAKVKFCRKPIGFLMSLLFVVVIAIVGLSFINLNIPVLNTFTALYQETEPKQTTDEGVDTEGEEGTEEEGTEEEGTEEAANAAADEESGEDTEGEGTEGEGEVTEGEDGEGTEEEAPAGTYYAISDPVFGWISFIGGKLGIDLDLGDSPWYDAQISKVEAGMTDTLAPILIQAFPAALILYVIFALSLFIKTFICWASNDRRIYRRTGIECIIMVILALVVALGGYAGTVEIDGTLDFAGIVNFLLGGVTGVGGFTAGYGMLILIIIPLVAFILSFFLLERKLRDRDVIQPIIFYDAR